MMISSELLVFLQTEHNRTILKLDEATLLMQRLFMKAQGAVGKAINSLGCLDLWPLLCVTT
jgi:hypothetical protein